MGSNAEFAINNVDFGKTVSRAEHLGLRDLAVIAWRDLEAPDSGGSEEHLTQVSQHWTNAGLSVNIRTAGVQDLPTQVERNGSKVIRKGGRVSVFPGAAFQVLRGGLGSADGVIDVFQGMPFLSPLWTRRPRVGLIHHCHMGTWSDLAPIGLAQLGYCIERFAIRHIYRSTPLVTLSPSSAEEIVKCMKIKSEQLRVGPVGIDSDFTPDTTSGETEIPLVVAGGRFMPPKGFDQIPAILSPVKKKIPALQAVIFGDGPEKSRIESQIQKYSAEDWITLPGFISREDQISLYQKAKLLIAPSRREGWNMTITEAAACGTPAVATKIPGHLDAVLNQQTGYLVENDYEMAEAIIAGLSDESKRIEMRKNSLEHAQKFHWEHTAAIILNALCDDAESRK
ncbi:MAG: D-inositol 3-phosphate glycosyltransferase [Acidimicrobiales bacterium AG-410-I20]|nr:MAG: D-inositol 3-phosphate glycosyltransferase [Acidimicrobiales bacterium AG-410-I20]